MQRAQLRAAEGRVKRHAHASEYVRGLLLDGERKSISPITERVRGSDVQALQQFVNQSPWAWARQYCRALGKTANCQVRGKGRDRCDGDEWDCEQTTHWNLLEQWERNTECLRSALVHAPHQLAASTDAATAMAAHSGVKSIVSHWANWVERSRLNNPI